MRLGLHIGLGSRGGGLAALPPPVVNALSSTTAERWSGAKTLTLTGQNFTPNAMAKVGSLYVPTSYLSPTSLQVTLARNLLWEDLALSLAVETASGTSGSQPYTVTQPSWLQAEYRANKGLIMNGSTLQGWSDVSGKLDPNRNWIQPTAALQPTILASDSSFMGKPSVVSNGTSQTLRSAGLWQVAAPITWFWVSMTTATDGFRHLMDANPGERRILGLNSPYTGLYAYAGSASIVLTNLATGSPFIATATYGIGTGSSLAFNAKTPAVSGDIGAHNPQSPQLFAANASQHYAGRTPHGLAAVPPNTATRNEIMDYLSSEYGIPVAA